MMQSGPPIDIYLARPPTSCRRLDVYLVRRQMMVAVVSVLFFSVLLR